MSAPEPKKSAYEDCFSWERQDKVDRALWAPEHLAVLLDHVVFQTFNREKDPDDDERVTMPIRIDVLDAVEWGIKHFGELAKEANEAWEEFVHSRPKEEQP